MILWYCMVQFLLGFLKYAPPYPCHSICDIDFNTIEPAFFAQSASGYFLARAKKMVQAKYSA